MRRNIELSAYVVKCQLPRLSIEENIWTISSVNCELGSHGTVIAVGEDAEYGNVVRIDHGNGYVTIYRCSLEVRVHEGDDVVKGDPLFLMSNGTTTLGYQILQNAEFINPSDVMELKG